MTNACRHVGAGDGVLFEFIDAQWRERGRGELRVNVAGGGQARLVMRQRGNLRLLLNANLFPGMKLTPMDGGKVGRLFQILIYGLSPGGITPGLLTGS